MGNYVSMHVLHMCIFGLLQLQKFLNDIAELLGLWLGVAIMTFIEFLELFVDISLLCTSKVVKVCRPERDRIA